MDIYDALLARHSVRQYKDEKISAEAMYGIFAEIEKINEESGLKFQFIQDDNKPFSGFFIKRKFENVKNYIAIVGPKDEDFDEKMGYFGEQLVLKAQMLGLNTCWVTEKVKTNAKIEKNEKLGCVIAIGYGLNQGYSHELRTVKDLSEVSCFMPKWFEQGMLAVILAPSSNNKQNYKFRLKADDSVEAVNLGGNDGKIDLGIAEYHFEIGAASHNFKWSE